MNFKMIRFHHRSELQQTVKNETSLIKMCKNI